MESTFGFEAVCPKFGANIFETGNILLEGQADDIRNEARVQAAYLGG